MRYDIIFEKITNNLITIVSVPLNNKCSFFPILKQSLDENNIDSPINIGIVRIDDKITYSVYCNEHNKNYLEHGEYIEENIKNIIDDDIVNHKNNIVYRDLLISSNHRKLEKKCKKICDNINNKLKRTYNTSKKKYNVDYSLCAIPYSSKTYIFSIINKSNIKE
jgi:hypothetical protein